MIWIQTYPQTFKCNCTRHVSRLVNFFLRHLFKFFFHLCPWFVWTHLVNSSSMSVRLSVSCLTVGEWWSWRPTWKKTHRVDGSALKWRHSCYVENFHWLQSHIDHQPMCVPYSEYCWPRVQYYDCQLPLLVVHSGICRQYTWKTNKWILHPARPDHDHQLQWT